MIVSTAKDPMPDKEISPAASAILDALNEVSWDWGSMQQSCPRTIAAAVLRAAIDSVVPEEAEAPRAQFDCPPRKLYNFGKKEEKSILIYKYIFRSKDFCV